MSGLVVGRQNGKPVYVNDVARVTDGPELPKRYVWHGTRDGEFPAVSIAISKKAGENAVDVADVEGPLDVARLAEVGDAPLSIEAEAPGEPPLAMVLWDMRLPLEPVDTHTAVEGL